MAIILAAVVPRVALMAGGVTVVVHIVIRTRFMMAGKPGSCVVVMHQLLVAGLVVVVLRERGAAYYASSLPNAFGLTTHPNLRPLAIDPWHSDAEVYGARVSTDGGADYRLFDVFGAWRAGQAPSVVVSTRPNRADTVCPP